MEFSKKLLRTGYIVEFMKEGSSPSFVFLDTENGDIVSGVDMWFPLKNYSDEDLFCYSDQTSIKAVYRPRSNRAFSLSRNLQDCELVWKRPPQKTEAQLKIEELQATIKKAQQQIEQLKEMK